MRSKITALVAAVAAAASAAGAARWVRGRKDVEASEPTVTAAKSPASEGRSDAAPEPAPVGGSVSSDSPDDLTAIKGLGKVKAAKLAATGITSYAQIAAWTDDDIAEVGLAVNTSPGQIKREDWVGQAKVLAEG